MFPYYIILSAVCQFNVVYMKFLSDIFTFYVKIYIFLATPLTNGKLCDIIHNIKRDILAFYLSDVFQWCEALRQVNANILLKYFFKTLGGVIYVKEI